MSRKILNVATFGLAGHLLGNKKKKKEEAAPAAATKGPIVTPLGGAAPAAARARTLRPGLGSSTILSNSATKLGG